ncbi:MAG: hypothetical protein Q7V05_00480 [Methanoregula sp.]|nr:hypothetical protein [Methanoregula sp.]
MVCDLTDGELFILNVLYTNRNFKQEAGYNSEKLKKNFSKKYNQNFDKAVKNLKNQGYITPIRKKDEKFYISDFKKAVAALAAHGFNVTTGSSRPL